MPTRAKKSQRAPRQKAAKPRSASGRRGHERGTKLGRKAKREQPALDHFRATVPTQSGKLAEDYDALHAAGANASASCHAEAHETCLAECSVIDGI